MIISHTYRYLFVELPRTGTTAISRELVQNYDGVRILRKHATYLDFLKAATPEEKKYFVFSCIRNPLDDAVSRYFKLRNDHRSRFTDPDKVKKRKNIGERFENLVYRDVNSSDEDFSSFFLKYYFLPYNSWASLGRKRYDLVIRFENIQADFETALRMIGIEPKSPLSARNVTAKRGRNYPTYYSPAAIRRARWVFGPYMKQWGYEFPPEWGEYEIPWWHEFEYQVTNVFRGFFWKYLRSWL